MKTVATLVLATGATAQFAQLDTVLSKTVGQAQQIRDRLTDLFHFEQGPGLVTPQEDRVSAISQIVIPSDSCTDISSEITCANHNKCFWNRVVDESGPRCQPDRGLAHEKMAGALNEDPKVTWVAGVNKRFVGAKTSYAAGLCGAKRDASKPTIDQKEFAEVNTQLPTNYDVRTKWEKACPSTNEIRDQADCGSCWAFGAAEAITDRNCIHSADHQQFHVSAGDIAFCCGFSCGNGCEGGYPSGAWSYWQQTGVNNGGQYNSSEGCYPYPIKTCDHHIKPVAPRQLCAKTIAPSPQCPEQCTNSADKGDWNTVIKGASSYQVQGVQNIQQEIFENGPVEGTFSVYEDFLAYKSGVYQHTTGQMLGGHAIKILGWGVEDGTDYWLVANSWNSDWGAEGYFKILKGQDECGIEDGVVAGMPSTGKVNGVF